jgi:hypothetical protein
MSTTQFPHSVTVISESKIKTEVIVAMDVDLGTSVFVRSEMTDDTEMSRTQTPHNVADSQDSTVQTERIVHRYPDSDDDITHDDVKHAVECNSMCLKHEYKEEKYHSPVMKPTVETGTLSTTTMGKQYT